MNGSHERDQALERLLRQSFKAPQQGVTAACLDAETMAAWADGGLSGAALELAETHVADCARCQALVGALARTHTIVVRPEPSPRRWLAWLVPLTAAAAAVALWVAVPRAPDAPAPQSTDQRQAVDEKAAETGSLNRLSRVESPAPEEQAKQAAPAPADLEGRERAQAQALEQRNDAGRRDADSLKDASEPLDAIASSAPANKAAATPAQAAPPASLKETIQVGAASGFAQDASIVIVSPDPAIRWRLAGSAVEHSTNGGSNWEAVFNGGGAALTAGAAPSASVFWVVGRDGVVLLSTDGRNFSRVPFPEMTDLSAVQAKDARSATVTTSDGRLFTTTDAGTTWIRQ